MIARGSRDDRPDYAACYAIAAAVAAKTGVGLVTYPTAPADRAGQALALRPAVASLLADRDEVERYHPVRQVQ